MISAGVPPAVAALGPTGFVALGPTGFAALAWGSILLVLAAFAYVVWALVAGRGDE